MEKKDIIRANIKVRGIVQGVGFRPFIHKQVTERQLKGWIRNTSDGAEIEIEGEAQEVKAFAGMLWTKAPKLALIEAVEAEYYGDVKGYEDFVIIESKAYDSVNTLISPDIGICDDCLKELFDPEDRRYKYPFINCTNCGPRFTIIKDIPYDRRGTTMAPFEMCGKCEAEYKDISDRRYHAQPDCCPGCGPEVFFADLSEASDMAEYFEKTQENNDTKNRKPEKDRKINELNGRNLKAIETAREYLEKGKIIAVKGLGGFHLACLAESPEIAAELRKRKQRDEKPFAIMVKDIAAAEKFCILNEAEKKALISEKRPIVLLEKKNKRDLLYISENNYIGIMLPYTPLHYLLFDGAGYEALIMTSANLSDRPIIYKNSEALSGLSEIADGFLLNNREIETRCDDSLLWIACGKEYPVRRSRGYVPFPVKISFNKTQQNANGCIKSILACGAEQKASFALLKGDHVFQSQHTGDLKNAETLENYEKQIKHFKHMFGIEPEAVACDLHPDYLSSEYASSYAEENGIRQIKVQHHHAHMASCMADNSLDEKCIGIIWDGTGLGTDGTVWGGEFLTGDYRHFKRAASVRPFRLPGGDKASKELYRSAISILKDSYADGTMDISSIFEKVSKERTEQINYMLDNDLNCPLCTSMGRLFDAVASILDIKQEASYEGQGAILLEAEAGRYEEYRAALKASDDKNPDEQADRIYPLDEMNVTDVFPYNIERSADDGRYIFDFRPMIREIVLEIEKLEADLKGIKSRKGRPEENSDKNPEEKAEVSRLAAIFMNTAVDMAVKIAMLIRKDTGLNKVVLSGGTFQNQYILKRLSRKLEAEGFEVFRHSRVSANDEGIAPGQIAAANALING